MQKIFNIAFVGCGFIGQLCHLSTFSKIKNCKIIALAEKRPLLAKKVAKKYNIQNVFFSHLDLIKSNLKIDAVIIITKRTMTGPISYDFLKKGFNIMTEKPMACSYAEAKKLIKMQKKKKSIFCVGYNKRSDNGVLEAKQMLDNILQKNKLGKIIYVRTHRYSGTGYQGASEDIKTLEKQKKNIEWRNSPHWIRNKKEKYAFHGYLNTFSHNINLLRFLLNEIPKVEYVDIKKNYGNLVVLKFKNFKCSLETKDYKDNYWEEYIKIFFQNGYMKISTPPQMKKNTSAQIEVFDRNSNLISIKKNLKGWSFQNQANVFIENLKNYEKNIISAEDSSEDIKIIENIWRKWLKKNQQNCY